MVQPWFFGLLFIIYILIEVVRYIRYLKIYHMLNKMNRYDNGSYPPNTRKSDSDKRRVGNRMNNFDKFMIDLETYPELLEDNLKDLYYAKTKTDLDDMNFEDVCESIYDMVDRNPKYISKIKKILKSYKSYQWETHKRKIFRGKTNNNRFMLRRTDIKSWFQLLPIYIVIKIYDFLINSYMRLIGYNVTNMNGIDIWHNGYDPRKGKPILFFHASVGGVTLQVATLHKYSQKYNLIMPDIPGMNFTDSGDPPFTMAKVCDTLIDFTKRNYSDDFSARSTQFHLMGHSLGNNFCCYLINHYPQLVDRYFCIEGQIFFHRSLKVYKEFEANVLEVPAHDLLTFPLLHRDVYAQYFIQRLMKLDEAFIYDLDSDENSHIKIYMYHSKSDSKFLIDAQLKYADIKEIPLDYHIFKGARSHGAFILNSEFRDYIFKRIEAKLD
jgi:pimeloyl-ACP methyl ester carboxylesterase